MNENFPPTAAEDGRIMMMVVRDVDRDLAAPVAAPGGSAAQCMDAGSEGEEYYI